jgi:hypothetical protein
MVIKRRNTKGGITANARKRGGKEKGIIDRLLDNTDFRRLTQDKAAGQDGRINQLTGRVPKWALEAEMTEYPGYGKNSSAEGSSGDSRNGRAEKTSISQILCKSTHQFFLASVQPISLTCNSLPDKELAQFREFLGRERMNELFILHKNC